MLHVSIGGGGGVVFKMGGFIFKWGGASWGESVLMGGVFKKNVGWGGGVPPTMGNPGTSVITPVK